MAQEFINRYRKQKRTVSLEEQTEEGVQFAAPVSDPMYASGRTSLRSAEHGSEQWLATATDEALAELSKEDRFTLASYYLDGRTLAEIARVLGLHESSVSRRLDRLATGLRKRILAALRAHGLSHAQAAEVLEIDVRDIELNLRARLTQDSGAQTFHGSSKIPAQDTGEGSSD
jgi:RNA polymerase sigma-70 factor (ECF subfamily)